MPNHLQGFFHSGAARFAGAAIASVLLPFLSHAQAVAIGAGYVLPRPIDVAPGQVITLFVSVPGKSAADAVTAQPPLPAELGGFSVLLRQSFPSDPVPAPIQVVADSQYCSSLAPSQCDVVTMITVQVPFELTPNVPLARIPANFARLDISYNGTAAASLALNPVPDRIHVLNTCDANTNYPGSRCASVITHPDGTVVDLEHPAQVGQKLTVAMAGLGQLGQIVATGAASPDSAPAVDNVRIAFDARPNQSPSLPSADSAIVADTARLRSGSVGVYEVTFTVPALPDTAPACSSNVRSNLTVSIGRTVSFDGAGICVDVKAAQ